MTLTHDGRLLLVAGYTATAVLSVSALEDGRGHLFPRDLSYDQTAGQVMLANFNSGTVEEFPAPGA